jgi:hypothetical protein
MSLLALWFRPFNARSRREIASGIQFFNALENDLQARGELPVCKGETGLQTPFDEP